MWDGITYVEPSRRPVVHEGFDSAHVILTNAGPGIVQLMVWEEPMLKPDEPPSFQMRMPPGNTRSASGRMVAVGLSEEGPPSSTAPFAAVGWRIVR